MRISWLVRFLQDNLMRHEILTNPPYKNRKQKWFVDSNRTNTNAITEIAIILAHWKIFPRTNSHASAALFPFFHRVKGEVWERKERANFRYRAIKNIKKVRAFQRTCALPPAIIYIKMCIFHNYPNYAHYANGHVNRKRKDYGHLLKALAKCCLGCAKYVFHVLCVSSFFVTGMCLMPDFLFT